jgi:hypothetical protein
MQRNDVWLNEFALAEVKVIELCISKVQKLRANRGAGNLSAAPQSSSGHTVSRPSIGLAPDQPVFTSSHDNFNSPNTVLSAETVPGIPWQAPWGDPTFTLFEPTDLQYWENVLDSITPDQMLFGLH